MILLKDLPDDLEICTFKFVAETMADDSLAFSLYADLSDELVEHAQEMGLTDEINDALVQIDEICDVIHCLPHADKAKIFNLASTVVRKKLENISAELTAMMEFAEMEGSDESGW